MVTLRQHPNKPLERPQAVVVGRNAVGRDPLIIQLERQQGLRELAKVDLSMRWDTSCAGEGKCVGEHGRKRERSINAGKMGHCST